MREHADWPIIAHCRWVAEIEQAFFRNEHIIEHDELVGFFAEACNRMIELARQWLRDHFTRDHLDPGGVDWN
ncbi:hypothetical protein D9M71_830080 [compost metagenome]